MSHAESILQQMEPDKRYTAKELAEHTHKPVRTIYAALRGVEHPVIERTLTQPEKGRAVTVFFSKQHRLFA
jgi:hypothetical protein